MAVGVFEREHLCRRMLRPFLAEIRIGWRTHPRGEPDPSLFVHHGVVIAGLAIPDAFVSPIRRRRHRVVLRGRRLWIADWMFHLSRRMRPRIEDRHVIRAFFRRSVELAIGVERRLAPVGPDQIVQVGRGAAPVPQGKNDVALHTLWPLRLRERQFAGGDAIGPIGPQTERALSTESADDVHHLGHRLSGLDAPLPRLSRILEFPSSFGMVRPMVPSA